MKNYSWLHEIQYGDILYVYLHIFLGNVCHVFKIKTMTMMQNFEVLSDSFQAMEISTIT
jgi:hypothetical protein